MLVDGFTPAWAVTCYYEVEQPEGSRVFGIYETVIVFIGQHRPDKDEIESAFSICHTDCVLLMSEGIFTPIPNEFLS